MYTRNIIIVANGKGSFNVMYNIPTSNIKESYILGLDYKVMVKDNTVVVMNLAIENDTGQHGKFINKWNKLNFIERVNLIEKYNMSKFDLNDFIKEGTV